MPRYQLPRPGKWTTPGTPRQVEQNIPNRRAARGRMTRAPSGVGQFEGLGEELEALGLTSGAATGVVNLTEEGTGRAWIDAAMALGLFEEGMEPEEIAASLYSHQIDISVAVERVHVADAAILAQRLITINKYLGWGKDVSTLQDTKDVKAIADFSEFRDTLNAMTRDVAAAIRATPRAAVAAADAVAVAIRERLEPLPDTHIGGHRLDFFVSAHLVTPQVMDIGLDATFLDATEELAASIRAVLGYSNQATLGRFIQYPEELDHEIEVHLDTMFDEIAERHFYPAIDAEIAAAWASVESGLAPEQEVVEL